MPYEVIMDADNCDKHSVVKVGSKMAIDGGCHDSHEEALDHAQALNIATADERSKRNEQMNAAIDEAIELLMAAKSAHMEGQKEAEEDEEMSNMAYGYADDEDDEEMSIRAVNISAPVFMRAAARRGLKYHEEGESGDGLMPQTVEDARKMVRGEITEAKWRKIAPWIARHLVDLDAPKNSNPNDPQYPGAGLVAHLLWGSGPSKNQAQRAQAYAERVVARLDEDRSNEMRLESKPAPKKDQIKGSDTNRPGSAKGKSGGIVLNDATEKALSNKVAEHNDDMRKANKPDWTRVSLGALKAVYRRGAGAYSTSHRPGISRGAWAMARVNAFLYLSRNGRPKNPKYVTDNDLLKSGHPKKT